MDKTVNPALIAVLHTQTPNPTTRSHSWKTLFLIRFTIIWDILNFKARELRAFLLFYSLPAFKFYFPSEYFQHGT